MIRRFLLALGAMFAFCAFQFLSPAHAQNPTRRLTTTRDVLEFIWAPRGDELYVTREGKIFSLSQTRQQITGDLYRVNISDGASELLARNANGTRAPIVGDEIAFARLNDDGSARAIIFDPRAKREMDMGEITFGATLQWNREGGTLFFAQDGKLRRATKRERGTLFQSQTFPNNARISPNGERVAFLDAEGLWVTQGNSRQNIARNENELRLLPQFVWSHAGDKLAYISTREGFSPTVSIFDAANGTTKKIAQGDGLEHFANLAWSPDDAFVIFTRAPTGSSSANRSEIWRARADGSDTRALTHNNAEETLAQYSPDGNSIAFLRDGDVWVFDLNVEGLPQNDEHDSQNSAPDFETTRAVNAQRAAPPTIRVRHDAGNSCRSVPLGQIDTFDFETYVKRVVPAEVFRSWDDDVLKTQAVAARTYAWFWILQHVMSSFDVTDTTAYQYMCDAQYASTDNAVEATRGQYLDYQGFMVFAAYGAENGDPTLTNSWGNPYLLGVDDPVGFMKTRAGNGIGYSQWGAQRWATQYAWNYQQILLHYYSNVTLESALGNAQDVTPPIAAIISPWNNWGVTSNRVHIIVNASDDSSGIATIDLNAQYELNGARNEIIATLVGSDREFVWDVSALPNQTDIVLTPIARDASGNTTFGASITFNLDRRKPNGTMTAPATTAQQTITLNLNASDAGGSALAGMMFSNDWEWQGEAQQVQADSGSVVGDADALNGGALRGLVGTNIAGVWYGPYANALPSNQPYRAYFRIKTDDVNTTDEIAMLDVVTDGGANILGLKRVRGADLKNANEYQEFYVDFYYTGFSTNALEFRVAYRANASLWLDRILVARYPVEYAPTTNWTLSNGHGEKRVIAKFLDGAGNVSADAVSTIFFGQNRTIPRVWLPFLIREK